MDQEEPKVECGGCKKEWRSRIDALTQECKELQEAMAARTAEKWQPKGDMEASKDRLMTIPPFPGEGKMNVVTWTEYRNKFATICRLNQMRELDKRLALGVALQGIAARRIEGLALMDQDKYPSLEKLLDAVGDRLLPPRDSEESTLELFTARQEDQETAMDFYRRVKLLWNRANPREQGWSSMKCIILNGFRCEDLKKNLTKYADLGEDKWIKTMAELESNLKAARLLILADEQGNATPIDITLEPLPDSSEATLRSQLQSPLPSGREDSPAAVTTTEEGGEKTPLLEEDF